MKWTFGYDGWLVWDGEYPDIEVGGTFEAGIEFWFVGKHTISDVETMQVEQLEPCRYLVTAKVVEVGSFVVLDLGQLLVSCDAASMSQSSDLRVGDTIRAKIGLALDPFGYYPESVARKKRWVVEKILFARHAESPNRSKTVRHATEEIPAVTMAIVDSRDWCVVECVMASGD